MGNSGSGIGQEQKADGITPVNAISTFFLLIQNTPIVIHNYTMYKQPIKRPVIHCTLYKQPIKRPVIHCTMYIV